MKPTQYQLKSISHDLWKRYVNGNPRSWVSSIGVAEDRVVVYARVRFITNPLPREIDGVPIELKYFGEFAPIGAVDD